MNTDTETDRRLVLAAQILSGLLASGHYTMIYGQNEPGQRYESDSPEEDEPCMAVEDALTILGELEQQMELRKD